MLKFLITQYRFTAMNIMILFWCGYIPLAWGAGFGIDATRVILEQKAGSATVSLRNTSDTPYLVRVSILDDDWKEVKGFNINPSILRMDGGSKSVVRVLYSPYFKLPQDRESVFYFHSTVIASGVEIDELTEINKGSLKVAVGTRVKLFFRPPAIGAPKKETFAKLKFTKDKMIDGLHVENQTPYHVSLLQVSVDDHKIRIPRENHMIVPYGKQTFSVKQKVSAKTKVQWSIINDLGAEVQYKGSID
ncbi:TPA: molecular chaperone [Aeromonas sobria]|nr:molecular chaperone [Aeromonas sobria]